jgi:hypothetical protein
VLDNDIDIEGVAKKCKGVSLLYDFIAMLMPPFKKVQWSVC